MTTGCLRLGIRKSFQQVVKLQRRLPAEAVKDLLLNNLQEQAKKKICQERQR